jgi:hypothetical protein
MPQPKWVGSLEIGQELDFQRQEWRVQRIGWVVMALIVLAGLLGLTGNGVLARATVSDPAELLRLEYARLDRVQTPTTLTVLIAGDAVVAEQVEVWVDREYLRGILIETIVPEPQEVRSAADGLLYVFAVDEPEEPLTVSFDVRHTGFGAKSGRVALVDGPALDFGQFVYP